MFASLFSNSGATMLMRTFGMSVPVYALVFGIVSGLTLPIGAVLGSWLSPVSNELCAAMMALGAGALLFAVTVELYGYALHELEHGKMGYIEIATMMVGAACGAFFYLSMNKLLEEKMSVEESPHSQDPERPKTLPMSSESESTPLRRAPTARDRWKIAKTKLSVVNLLSKGNLENRRGRDKALTMIVASQVEKEEQTDQEKIKAQRIALSLFLGILIDGVPEGILMGILAAEGHLALSLIFSLLIANFPEAFSSASLSKQAGLGWGLIVGMWGSLCLLTGGLCGLSCWLMLWMYPDFETNGHLPLTVLIPVALIEGITGGAMIACISAVMLPEAFQRSGGEKGRVITSSGFLCPIGFIIAVTIKCIGG